jgi:hypothetical protein
VKRALLVLVAAAGMVGCPFGQSSHCGDEYARNMTHVKSGWYELVPTSGDATDPLSSVHEIHIVKDPAAQTISIETSDGRAARYHVLF